MLGNEYIIWGSRDRHRNAYRVLTEQRSIRMARALGYKDAEHEPRCLACHADYVPESQRGAQFQLSDGVGCEACHGGASGWLGIHISGASHDANIAAGLYPTDRPLARAEKCLGCHYGDKTRFVDHLLIGAGHPRLPFELDTFTAAQPAHFVVDPAYIARKGRVTDLQVWAVGEAVALIKRMDTVLDPKRARSGLLPEFVLFECQSCHHNYDSLHAPRPTATGLGPGTIKFNDANAVMLRLAASRVAPDAAKALSAHMMALHKATTDDWAGVEREATAVRKIAAALVPLLTKYEFTADDMRALSGGAIAVGTGPDNWQSSHAEQVTMTLEAIVTSLRSAGIVGNAQADSMMAVLIQYKDIANEATYRPEPFVKALRALQPGLGK